MTITIRTRKELDNRLNESQWLIHTLRLDLGRYKAELFHVERKIAELKIGKVEQDLSLEEELRRYKSVRRILKDEIEMTTRDYEYEVQRWKELYDMQKRWVD